MGVYTYVWTVSYSCRLLVTFITVTSIHNQAVIIKTGYRLSIMSVVVVVFFAGFFKLVLLHVSIIRITVDSF